MLPLAFGFGNPTEIAIIAGVVILLFGGSKLAGFGKSMGQGIKEFKKATEDEKPEQAPSVAVYDKTASAPTSQEAPVTAGAASEEKARL